MKTLRGILLAVSGLLLAVSGALTDGCASQRFLSGSHVAVGAYVPSLDGSSLYGIEIFQYLNGCLVTVDSNHCLKVERDCVATNSYLFGAFRTEETSHVKVETTK